MTEARTKTPSVSSLSHVSEEEDKKYFCSHVTTQSVEEAYYTKLDKVSQEERDAAHNLVQLHMHSISIKDKDTHHSRCTQGPTNSIFSSAICRDGGNHTLLNQYQHFVDSDIKTLPQMMSSFPSMNTSYMYSHYGVPKKLIEEPYPGKDYTINVYRFSSLRYMGTSLKHQYNAFHQTYYSSRSYQLSQKFTKIFQIHTILTNVSFISNATR